MQTKHCLLNNLGPEFGSHAFAMRRAREWEDEAEALRELADRKGLGEDGRAMLRRQADAADRQAAWWRDSI
jgi:hypothetical protein